MKAVCCNAAAVFAASPRARSGAPGTVMNPATGPALPSPGVTLREGRLGKRLAVRRLGYVRHGHQHLAGLGVVLADRVLPKVDESLFVHRHAMPLRRVKGADDVSVLVAGAIMPGDVDHRRRVDATIGNRRIQLRFDFDGCEIVRTIVDPNVVVLIHGQAGHAAHLPLVGQGLGPARIDFELRRRLRLRGRCRRQEKGETKAKRACTNPFVSCHGNLLLRQTNTTS